MGMDLADLAWEPAGPVQGEPINTPMKNLLADRYAHGDELALDGMLIPNSPIITAWLEGIRDAINMHAATGLYADAVDLIEALKEHDQIRLKLVT